MLFRTALALMELYGKKTNKLNLIFSIDHYTSFRKRETIDHLLAGPSLTTSKDAGDAITLLQSLAGSTFDSSQLVITACMGFLTVTEAKLQDLRNKHRPSVLGIIEETRTGSKVSKESKSIATKLYSFKRPQGGKKESRESGLRPTDTDGSENMSPSTSPSGDLEEDSVPDLEEEVIFLLSFLAGLVWFRTSK